MNSVSTWETLTWYDTTRQRWVAGHERLPVDLSAEALAKAEATA